MFPLNWKATKFCSSSHREQFTNLIQFCKPHFGHLRNDWIFHLLKSKTKERKTLLSFHLSLRLASNLPLQPSCLYSPYFFFYRPAFYISLSFNFIKQYPHTNPTLNFFCPGTATKNLNVGQWNETPWLFPDLKELAPWLNVLTTMINADVFHYQLNKKFLSQTMLCLDLLAMATKSTQAHWQIWEIGHAPSTHGLLMDTAYLPTITGICILCYMFPAYLCSFIRTKSHTFWDLCDTKHAQSCSWNWRISYSKNRWRGSHRSGLSYAFPHCLVFNDL